MRLEGIAVPEVQRNEQPFETEPVSRIQRIQTPLTAPYAAEQTVRSSRPKLWATLACVIFCACVTAGGLLAFSGEYMAALYATVPATICGLLLSMADDLGCPT